ncbi:MAG: hypothetical protein HYR77_00215 [Ignavibacteria bacterium]|nr:hypothetical protein [Ignavibacteria bacterium]
MKDRLRRKQECHLIGNEVQEGMEEDSPRFAARPPHEVEYTRGTIALVKWRMHAEKKRSCCAEMQTLSAGIWFTSRQSLFSKRALFS